MSQEKFNREMDLAISFVSGAVFMLVISMLIQELVR